MNNSDLPPFAALVGRLKRFAAGLGPEKNAQPPGTPACLPNAGQSSMADHKETSSALAGRDDVNRPVFSCSQSGEDRIVQNLFSSFRNQTKLFYVDIGSAFPVADNNTFIFYLAGGCGVTVEADPQYIPQYQMHRPRDRNLSLAVVPERLKGDGTVTFYKMNNRGHSTASEEIFKELDGKRDSLLEKITTPAITINELLVRETEGQEIDLLSIDIEGLDLEVLSEVDYSRFRPKVIIAENSAGCPVHREVLERNRYGIFAYTHINTIYIVRELFNLQFENSVFT